MKNNKIEKYQTSGRFKKTPNEYLENLKNFVFEKYNGELLSKEWGNYKKTLYSFRDTNGIEFERTAYEVMHNNLWTPNKGLMAKLITKQIFEYIFKCNFIKNNTILNSEITQKGNWELDGYNEDLGIAFEYQGFSSHWNKRDTNFTETQERDLLKKDLCKKMGIVLIQIPTYSNYDLNNFRDDVVFNHVLEQINKTLFEENKEFKFSLPKDKFKINFNSIPHSIKVLEEIKKVAEDNNAQLISTEYRGNLHKYKFYDNTFFIEHDVTWKELKRVGYVEVLEKAKKKNKIINI